MKKALLTLAIAFLGGVTGFAQDETVMQPTHVVGKRINAEGTVTKEYEAAFSYDTDGKLHRFQFSEYGVTSTFNYEDGYLQSVLTLHEGTWPIYDEALRFTYEDGRVKQESHLWSDMNTNEYVLYEYYEDGRLARKNYASYHPEDVHSWSQFEYENQGRTRIETHTTQAFRGLSAVTYVDYRVTCQYDENYTLLSEQKDQYDPEGEHKGSTRTSYTYTDAGKLEAKVTQKLTVGLLWMPQAIHQYVYDAEGLLTEQREGIWSVEQSEWVFTKKTVHEYSADRTVYTATFYKKSGDEWVLDTFNGQQLFFEPELKWQQNALNSFAFEDLMGSALVNQFEFEITQTPKPTYYAVGDKENRGFAVFPNPGRDALTVTAPMENAVVRIYDLRGRLVLAKPFDFQTDIHTGDWATGVYLWEVWNGFSKAASGKWVKQ